MRTLVVLEIVLRSQNGYHSFEMKNISVFSISLKFSQFTVDTVIINTVSSMFILNFE